MKPTIVWFALMVIVLLAASISSIGVGAVSIAPREVIHLLAGKVVGEADAARTIIIWELRLPRVLLALLVGAGLGSAGAGYQGLFRNPLADPFIIGASSGAALGATLAIVLGWTYNAWGLSPIAAAAFLGALLTVTLVYGIAAVGRQLPTTSLLLAGVAVSSLIGSVVSLLMFLNDEKLVNITGWMMGSLSGRGWNVLGATALPILASISVLWICARGLDALTFGEETARALALNMTQFRIWVVGGASLATAAAVSASGVVAFVGLIAPHIARLFVGPRHGLVIPGSALVGALLLLVADGFARTLVAPTELPLGVITALLGSPFFIYLLKTRQRDPRHGGV